MNLPKLRARLAARRKRLRELKRARARLQRQIHTARFKVRHTQTRIAKAHSSLTLRERAFDQAEKMLGVIEQGGNNRGPEVSAIILANGGVVGEPWCGDFVAWCYRRAGSSAVDRSWASVGLVGSDKDVRKTINPKRGDLVRFTFDHIGLFEKDLGNGYIQTIEGNTGSSGAVSDSHSGTDGVKRKIRSKSLVRDYLEVR